MGVTEEALGEKRPIEGGDSGNQTTIKVGQLVCVCAFAAASKISSQEELHLLSFLFFTFEVMVSKQVKQVRLVADPSISLEDLMQPLESFISLHMKGRRDVAQAVWKQEPTWKTAPNMEWLRKPLRSKNGPRVIIRAPTIHAQGKL